MKSICVYLGANPGTKNQLLRAATELGQAIAARGLRLVYGGSSHGLMGALAQAVLKHGGQVTGIIPKTLLEQETPLDTLDKLIITDTMQERKMLMQQHADAFLVMPGGIGTLEEAFETWNAIKIGTIHKPIGFLNLDGFYDGLFAFMTHCEQQGFVSAKQLHIPLVDANPQKLIHALCENLSAHSEALAL